MTAVIFDGGGVLIDWNPRHLYRKLFDGDADDAMERFLAEVCTPEWNLRQDAGRPFAEAVAELAERFLEHADLIAAYDLRWEEMLQGAHVDRRDRPRIEGARNASLLPHKLLDGEVSVDATPLRRVRSFRRDRRFGRGMVKPDPAVYRCLIERFGLQAPSCLFIDDVEANVAAASSIGMQAVRYRSAPQLRHELQRRGALPTPG
jgi:2-haloacid dehalogenase